MTTTFADRWGVPVQAGNGAAVLLLDQAVEVLVALSGDPAGGAEAAHEAPGSQWHQDRQASQDHGGQPGAGTRQADRKSVV